MDNKEKIRMLEDMMELDEGTLREDMVLKELERWDSMAALSLIVLLDEEFNRNITAKEIKNLKTVSDILNVMY